MANQKGTNVLLQIGSSVVHATLSKSLDMTTDMIEVTNDQSTNEFKEYLPGDKGATINIEGIIEEGEATNYAIEDLNSAWSGSTSLTFIYGGTTSGDMTATGSGYLSALSWSDPHNDRRTFTATIQVTGSVTFGTVT